MNGTGGSSPQSSHILTSPTSVPASPSQLAVTTGKGPAVKMVRCSHLGLLAEVGHLEGPQISGFLFVALVGINRSSWVPFKRRVTPSMARAFVLALAFIATICVVAMFWHTQCSELVQVSPPKSSVVSKALSNKNLTNPLLNLKWEHVFFSFAF